MRTPWIRPLALRPAAWLAGAAAKPEPSAEFCTWTARVRRGMSGLAASRREAQP